MEQRIREKAVKAVSDILKTAGYEVHHAAPPLDLSAVKANTILVVLCSNDRDEIEQFSSTDYSVKTDSGEKNCSKLLFTFDSSVEAEQCTVWYPEDFVRYAGEAVLARVVGKQIHLNSSGLMDDLGEKGSDHGAPEKGGVRVPHLPVRVHREEAENQAGIPGIVTLKFIPYWLFRYTSRGETLFKDQRISFDGTGTGAINAINGTISEIDPDSVTRRELPGGVEVMKMNYSKDEASGKILDYLIDAMTKRVKARQVKGDAIFYEEKNVSPDRDNISLELKELYIPIWQIKGKKIVEINAYSGERLREPMDDGVEVY